MSVNAIWALIVVVLFCFIGMAAAFTLQREHEMDLRCEHALGPGASYAGWASATRPGSPSKGWANERRAPGDVIA